MNTQWSGNAWKRRTVLMLGCALACNCGTAFTQAAYPARPLKLISPFPPGAIGSFGGAAVVQPHEDCTWVILMGLAPVFLYLKCATAVLSDRLGCKSASGFSQTSAALAEDPRARTITITKSRTRVFIMLFQEGKRKPKFRQQNRYRPLSISKEMENLIRGAWGVVQ